MRHFIFVFVGMLALTVGPRANAQSIEEGLSYLEQDKYTSAGRVFKSLVNGKASGENLFYLGYYYMHVDELDSARMQFERGVAADRKNGLSHVGLGSLALKQGRKGEAKTHFEQAKAATRKKNQKAEVFHRIGEAYLMHEGNTDPAEAVAHAQEALQLDPNLANAYVVIGDAALEKLDGTTAANNYDRALGINPKLLKTHVRLGDLFVRSKNLNAARDKYNEALAADSSYAPAYRKLAEVYYSARQYDKALENMERYMSLADKSPSNQFRYAGFLILVGKHQEALSILSTLQNQYSNSAVYNRLMGYANYETNQCPQGLEFMNKYFAMAKPDAMLGSDYEYLGKLQICTGSDTAQAIENIVKGIGMDSTRLEGLRDVAQKFFDAKAYSQAKQVMQRYIGVADDKANANDYYLAGLSGYFGGDYAYADSAFTDMLAVIDSSKQAIGYQWRAKTRVRQDVEGTAGTAESDYQKFFELARNDADSAKYDRELANGYFYMAILNLKKYKNLAEAHQYANQMLAIDPNDKRAKQVLSFKQKDLEPGRADQSGSSVGNKADRDTRQRR